MCVIRKRFMILISAFLITMPGSVCVFAEESGPNQLRGLYSCATSFLPRIPPNALIVSSGGACRDENGYPVA